MDGVGEVVDAMDEVSTDAMVDRLSRLSGTSDLAAGRRLNDLMGMAAELHQLRSPRTPPNMNTAEPSSPNPNKRRRLTTRTKARRAPCRIGHARKRTVLPRARRCLRCRIGSAHVDIEAVTTSVVGALPSEPRPRGHMGSNNRFWSAKALAEYGAADPSCAVSHRGRDLGHGCCALTSTMGACSTGRDEAARQRCTATIERMLLPSEELDLNALKSAAGQFSVDLSNADISELYGTTDGKAVGSYVEKSFNAYLAQRFDFEPGNAARGIDFPDLGIDLKVTSIKQPQSSCPFRSAEQKVYGLGYHQLVFVYEKSDDSSRSVAHLDIKHVVFIDAAYTADFQTTTGICKILDATGNVDDLDAFIQERNLPLDDIGRRNLAERLVDERPLIGCLTISNAQQWRLQYTRAIAQAESGESLGVENLNG